MAGSNGNGSAEGLSHRITEAEADIKSLRELHGQLEMLFGKGAQRVNHLQTTLDHNSDAMYQFKQELRNLANQVNSFDKKLDRILAQTKART